MKGDDLVERFLDFEVRICNVVDALPDTRRRPPRRVAVGAPGTAGGPNYEEGCAAESRRDFCHKLGIVLKELRESRHWLRLIVRGKLISEIKMSDIVDESDQLCRIIGKSIATAKGITREKEEDEDQNDE